MGRHSGVPLETRGVVAELDVRNDRVELWTSSQIPFQVHHAVCAATGWGPDRLRVAVPDVGGGFGPKANIYPEELVVAILARRLRSRVAWIEDRAEHMVATAHSRDQVVRARLHVDEGGRILGYEASFVVDLGAANLWLAGVVANSAIHAHGPYRVPAFDIRGYGVLTNKTPTSQYRGAGRPEACFALERSLDAAAHATGTTGSTYADATCYEPPTCPTSSVLPYRDGVPIVFDGGDYGATLDAAAELFARAHRRGPRVRRSARVRARRRHRDVHRSHGAEAPSRRPALASCPTVAVPSTPGRRAPARATRPRSHRSRRTRSAVPHRGGRRRGRHLVGR